MRRCSVLAACCLLSLFVIHMAGKRRQEEGEVRKMKGCGNGQILILGEKSWPARPRDRVTM